MKNPAQTTMRVVSTKFEPEIIAAIDDARRKKTPIPSRSAMIRDFVKKGLAKQKKPA